MRRHPYSISTCTDLAVSPQFHVDKKGRVNFAQTELLIHVVNRETNRILDVERYVSHWSEPMVSLLDQEAQALFCPQGDSDDR